MPVTEDQIEELNERIGYSACPSLLQHFRLSKLIVGLLGDGIPSTTQVGAHRTLRRRGSLSKWLSG
jgi:hypothetical protein